MAIQSNLSTLMEKNRFTIKYVHEKTGLFLLFARKSIFHNFANIRSIKQAIKHDFRNSTFGTRVFFMFFNQVNRQFS